MFVVVPVKFDNCVLNIAGIHYRINSIRIEARLLKALGGAPTNSQNVKDCISSTYILKISSHYITLDFLVQSCFGKKLNLYVCYTPRGI